MNLFVRDQVFQKEIRVFEDELPVNFIGPVSEAGYIVSQIDHEEIFFIFDHPRTSPNHLKVKRQRFGRPVDDDGFKGVIVVKNPFKVPCSPYDGQKLYGGVDNYLNNIGLNLAARDSLKAMLVDAK